MSRGSGEGGISRRDEGVSNANDGSRRVNGNQKCSIFGSSSLHELMKEYAGKTFFLLSDNDYIFTTPMDVDKRF